MPRKNFKCTSVIICDDIRQEATGKQILVGVYTGAVILPAFPTVLEKLCIRITGWVYQGAGTHSATLALDGPKRRNILRDDNISLNVTHPDQQAVLNVTMRPFEFQEQGTYKIRFGVEGPARQIGTFVARLPESAREKMRLQTDQYT